VTLPARIGRYEVELLLGEGGWGRVFLARDPMLRRQVAIKVLRDDLGPPRERGKALAERVREEARAAATLSHPGLVALHDMGDDEQVGLYLVFELVRGPTLRERLHEGPLGAEEVGRIAVALAAALSHAHAAGLVHRTVKPENVMIAPTGPKLTDFGLGVQDSRPPAYVAPEVLASAGSGALSDEFALAATMYEALTGRRAFPGEDSGAVAALVETGKHAPPRSVHPALRGYLGLDAVFARAFSPLPSKRFPSCEAFAAGLAGALQGPRITFLATPGPVRSSIAQATRRWQNQIALAAAAVILTLVVLGHLRQTGAGENASAKKPDAGKSTTSMHRVVPPLPAGASPSASTSASPSATSSARVPESPPSSAGRTPLRNEAQADKPGPPHVDP